MFGWEFPPYVSGGLGVACEGLVRGTPRAVDGDRARPSAARPILDPGPAHPRCRNRRPRLCDRAPRTRRERRVLLKLRRVRTLLRPYLTEETYEEEIETLTAPDTEAPVP